MSRPDLSVVVPAFNEESRLADTLKRIMEFLDERDRRFEILVVDDGSKDRTAAAADHMAARFGPDCLRVLRNDRNRGKGYSVRRGMLAANGVYALLTDADLSTPIEELDRLEEYLLRGGHQIAFGSRDIAGAEVLVHQSRLRENAGKIFNHIVRFLTRLPYRDTQCGFKLFETDACREIFRRQRIDRFAFDVEILFIARLWGLSLVEVPVVWRHAEGSKVRLFPDAPLTMLDLLRIEWNHLTGAYRPPSRPAA